MTNTRESIWKQTDWHDVMVRAYLECALWTEELDNNDIDDLSDCAIEQAIKDCTDFADQFHDHILYAHQQCKYDQARAGHDLCLTRNGHGAGFWDRNLGQLGDDMTAKAKSMGSCHLYKGNDGKLYFEKG